MINHFIVFLVDSALYHFLFFLSFFISLFFYFIFVWVYLSKFFRSCRQAWCPVLKSFTNY